MLFDCELSIEEYANMCFTELQAVKVVDKNDNVIASTDFTDKVKNFEVWKAIGLQEEDFYR